MFISELIVYSRIIPNLFLQIQSFESLIES